MASMLVDVIAASGRTVRTDGERIGIVCRSARAGLFMVAIDPLPPDYQRTLCQKALSM
jgi:hypothetical protein